MHELGLERRLVEAEAEANRRRRVLEGLNSRVEEAQAEMTEKTDAIAEMAIQCMSIEGELKTRQEDHVAIMMGARAKQSELERLLATATTEGKALDENLQTASKLDMSNFSVLVAPTLDSEAD
jgi:chromosome segregation ATPase